MANKLRKTGISRRKVLGGALGLAAASIGLSGCGDLSVDAFMQKHFKELSQEDLAKIFKRLEEEYSKEFGKEFKVNAASAIPGVLFGYALDISRCRGCRRCEYACVKENNTSRNPQIHYIRVSEIDASKGVDLVHARLDYNPAKVPEPGRTYIPVQCQHCREAPCTKVCPTHATWTEPDGIVVVDYNWCIGCRMCMAACPYGARFFNWAKPQIRPDEVNTDVHYLGNRPRPVGVVSKCSFCINRVRRGRYPACVEICPSGARKFGNLLDPESEIRQILLRKKVFVLQPELDTQPKFYYFYSVGRGFDI